MKNWLPPELGSPPRAMERVPVTCGRLLNSAGRLYPGPPVPTSVALGSLLFGSPPWMTNPGTTRWQVVPLKKPVLARCRKLATVTGALSGKNRSTMSPLSVFITASTLAPSCPSGKSARVLMGLPSGPTCGLVDCGLDAGDVAGSVDLDSFPFCSDTPQPPITIASTVSTSTRTSATVTLRFISLPSDRRLLRALEKTDANL